MDNFKYKVSVIIPVYNAQKHLGNTLDSLIEQTMERERMQIILVDDGSTDKSLALCKEYQANYPAYHFLIITQENAGPSAARNLGMCRAEGEYLMFLDSDDTIKGNTVQNLVKFFDAHKEEIDAVTYPEVTFINGVEQKRHFRYQFLKKSGIYDLEKFPFALQTRLGICMKNRLEDRLLFDENMKYHEDQKFIAKLLQDKMKIGFCAEACYYYNRLEGGIMSSNTNALSVFEVAVSFYEDLFAHHETVPAYYQAMLMHDLSWKLRTNSLFPYHYEEEQFEHAMDRIKALLMRVAVETIRMHPGIDEYHKYYFLRMRGTNITFFSQEQQLRLLYRNEILYQAQKLEIVVNAIKVIDGRLKILALIKSPVLDFTGKPQVVAKITENGSVLCQSQELFSSAESYYRCKTKTNCFWGFCFEREISQITDVSFFAVIEEREYDLSYYFMESSPMSHENHTFFAKHHFISFENNSFHIEAETKESTEGYLNALCQKLKQVPVLSEAVRAAEYHRNERIWLYYDCKGVWKDNGYEQFLHDKGKEDGIKRYYICANDIQKWENLFADDMHLVVEFGSLRHKKLFLNAEKIITAYIERKNICPFNGDEYRLIKSCINQEIVYLQHGVLHAHLPWKYAPGRIDCDRIVVSSKFEQKNFHEIYGFPEHYLIPAGMARFEALDNVQKPGRKILFAPSWRNYLIGSEKGNRWELSKEKFLQSQYYLRINEFLNSDRLNELLETYDMELDFKIHPIFKPYLAYFTKKAKRVRWIEDQLNAEEYALFITDFSSYVFDFAYLQRAILYFVPDMLEFSSGMNQYWELDLPLEQGFGECVRDEGGAVLAMEKILQNDCRPDKIYFQRMNNFFFDMKDCREKVYQYLKKEMDGHEGRSDEKR